MPGAVLRWTLAGVGVALLVSDVAQDWSWFSLPEHRTGSLLLATLVRNGLLLAAVAGLALNRPWGYKVLGLSALLGLVRRGLFLQGPLLAARSVDDPVVLFAHSGADVMFRLLALAVVLDFFRSGRSQG